MQENIKLTISRCASLLFVERGVAGTGGDDIAAAVQMSTRTVWRHFRNKESCAEPLLEATALKFIAMLRDWPRRMSIEDYLQVCLGGRERPAQDIADEVLAVRLIAMLPDEPALRSAWLMATQRGEEALADVIADRLERSAREHEVRLCAATVMAAIRVVDETISTAAVRHAQALSMQDVIDRMARAIRAGSTLPICDPVVA